MPLICVRFVLGRFGDNVKILHFIGQLKPWLVNFDPVSKSVYPPPEYKHMGDYLNMWWNTFVSDIHPKLSKDMVSARSILTHTLNAPIAPV